MAGIGVCLGFVWFVVIGFDIDDIEDLIGLSCTVALENTLLTFT
jgi:hypothetical protein